MRKLIQTLLLFICCFISLGVYAQTGDTQNAQVDVMNSNGKIYVVMAVVTVIVLGLFIYLIGIERKLKKLEKNS